MSRWTESIKDRFQIQGQNFPYVVNIECWVKNVSFWIKIRAKKNS